MSQDTRTGVGKEILSMQLQKILAPIDFSDHASHALRWGASLAERYGAQILLLHVIPETVGEMSMHGSAWEQVIMALEAKVETQLFEVALMEPEGRFACGCQGSRGQAG